MKEKPTVLVLDSPAGVGITVQVVQCLAAAGTFGVEVASPHPDSILRHSRWVRGFHFLERTSDPARALDQIKTVLRRGGMDILLPINVDQIDFLITHGDAELRSLARLSEQPEREAFQTACSKTLLSAFMEKHGIPHPRTVRFASGDPEILEHLASLRLPVITKPTWGGGGSGMRVFENREGLVPYLEEKSTPENPVIVQEYIRGHDLGSAAFCNAGEVLHLTMQRNMSADQNSFRPSKGLRFFDDPNVRTVVEKLMGALKWSGIAQIDLRVDGETGDLFVLEINPRYWGSVLGSQRMGVNFPEIACRRAIGLPVPAVEYRKEKYITSFGYLLHLRDKLLGRASLESFTYADSAFGEIVKDPMVRVVEVIQRLTKRRS